jgi:hypothetical protein
MTFFVLSVALALAFVYIMPAEPIWRSSSRRRMITGGATLVLVSLFLAYWLETINEQKIDVRSVLTHAAIFLVGGSLLLILKNVTVYFIRLVRRTNH